MSAPGNPPVSRLTEGSAPDGAGPALLLQRALAVADQPGGAPLNLFVLDRSLTLIYLNEGAERGVQAADADLRRAFGVGAGELLGHSILRCHPAPSRLQAILLDPANLPREVSWSFGTVSWRARLHGVRGPDDQLLGFAVTWWDATAAEWVEALYDRLRLEAEELPMPVMYPDGAKELWFGNPACDHALERLAPYLPAPVNPLLGIPIGIFLPDEAERRRVLGDPSCLPFKKRIRIGPETVSVLVSAVRDQAQRYAGPLLTWEIVHYTGSTEEPRPAPPAPAAVVPPPEDGCVAPVPVLRRAAAEFEAAARDLGALSRLLLTAADHAATRVAAGTWRPSPGPRGAGAGTDANPLIVETALHTAWTAVDQAAGENAGALARDMAGLGEVLRIQLDGRVARVLAAVEAERRLGTAATGLVELWNACTEVVEPDPAPVTSALSPASQVGAGSA